MKQPRLTRAMLSRSRVIAKSARIRDLARLLRQYGGRASGWVKKSSPTFYIGRVRYEYHWYEHTGLGRFEMKLKRSVLR